MNEPSIFSSDKFVSWKRERKMYNFSSLPKTALICAQKISVEPLKSIFSKKITGIVGNHFTHNKNLLVSSGFGVGAPTLIALCEELSALGVQTFYFVGVAGRLKNSIKEGDSFFISKAISEEGCSKSYANKEVIENEIPSNFKDIQEAICWTTDTPFRETKRKMNLYTSKNASLVDMETAALYNFAKFYSLQAFSFLIGADFISEKEWEPVKNMKNINYSLQKTVRLIVDYEA